MGWKNPRGRWELAEALEGESYKTRDRDHVPQRGKEGRADDSEMDGQML